MGSEHYHEVGRGVRGTVRREILSNCEFIYYVYLNHPLNKDVRAIRDSAYPLGR